MNKNHIEQAYEQGKRIRLKDWLKDLWIKKHSSEQSINSIGAYHLNDDWTFYEYPEQWEIWHEDIKTETQTEAFKNYIEEAYHAGKRICYKKWANGEWIKKHNKTNTIDDMGTIFDNKRFDQWGFKEHPEEWRVHPEDIDNQNQIKDEATTLRSAIDRAINLLKSNGYEVYKIEKIKQ